MRKSAAKLERIKSRDNTIVAINITLSNPRRA
jgi:hypothetical protein